LDGLDALPRLPLNLILALFSFNVLAESLCTIQGKTLTIIYRDGLSLA